MSSFADKLGTCLRVLFASAALLGLANGSQAQAASPSTGLVTVRDGHLSRDGKRLRIWGVNLQSGVFKSYEEIDHLVGRLSSLGFNAIRLWPTSGTFYKPSTGEPLNSVKGDGSALDRFDYLVAKASAAHLSLQMTMLHYVDLPTLRHIDDPGVAAWVSAARNDSELRTIHGFAPYISPEYRRMLEAHMARLLARKNPYTGRSYANEPAVSSWELANESHFVECALTPSCVQALPPIVSSTLSQRWQESSLNASHAALPADLRAMTSSPDYPSYSRFVAEAFVRASEEMESHARKSGGSGSGISVQPFIFNTGPTSPNAVAHYAYSRGDVFSIGAYSSPLKPDGVEGSVWRPASAGGSIPPNLAFMKVLGKPLVIYETSFFRPFPYRAEWGPVFAALALQQDWDGAFLYQYGQPQSIYTAGGKPEGYGTVPLAEPAGGNAKGADYAFGFNHGSDPVAMASWSVASRLFRSVTENAEPQTLWRIPLNQIFQRADGYPPGTFGKASALALKGATVFDFAPDGSTPCNPCDMKGRKPTTFQVDWGSLLMVKTPSGTAVTGVMRPGPLPALAGGISATVVDPGFAVVATLTDDPASGAPAAPTMMVIGDVTNSGMAFERAQVDFSSPTGAMRGLRSRGGLPLRYGGPSVDFTLPNSDVEVIEENFGLLSTKDEPSGKRYRYSATQGIFRARLQR